MPISKPGKRLTWNPLSPLGVTLLAQPTRCHSSGSFHWLFFPQMAVALLLSVHSEAWVSVPDLVPCQWPYHAECTGSHLNTKVKQHWAGIVPGWETTWEHPVLLTFFCFFSKLKALLHSKSSLPGSCRPHSTAWSLYGSCPPSWKFLALGFTNPPPFCSLSTWAGWISSFPCGNSFSRGFTHWGQLCMCPREAAWSSACTQQSLVHQLFVVFKKVSWNFWFPEACGWKAHLSKK